MTAALLHGLTVISISKLRANCQRKQLLQNSLAKTELFPVFSWSLNWAPLIIIQNWKFLDRW